MRTLWRWWLRTTGRAGWAVYRMEDAAFVAVVPQADVIGHDRFSDECVCGPTMTLERPATEDEPDGWLLMHHALDGRE